MGTILDSGKQSFIFSRTIQSDLDENVNFVAGDLISFVKNLKLQDGKDIWLVGGAAAERIASVLINKYGSFTLEILGRELSLAIFFHSCQ
ncbi:MAG: hypothetical protein DCF20_16510 [Pseudanabaena sp.]|nr:MAG: hypothetical protein DCF20_16510 [Pseudanabaena sp.]